ncbi:uncharacterized protein [Apostichopus japonicus]
MEKGVTNSSCSQLAMSTTMLPSHRLLPSGTLLQGYMFEGGTSFGFWNEANGEGGDKFKLRPTRYDDNNTPLSEAVTISDAISRYSGFMLYRTAIFSTLPVYCFSIPQPSKTGLT